MTAPPIPYGPGFLGLPADATEQDILDYAKTYAEEHHDAQAGNLVALLVQRLSQPIADDNHKALVEALDGGLLSTSSQGHPEPAKRNAVVRVEYFGEGSLAKAHRLADTLAVFIDSQAEKLP